MLQPGHFRERKLWQSILQNHEMHHPSHFIELNFLANHFIADGHGPVQFIQRVGQPEMT